MSISPDPSDGASLNTFDLGTVLTLVGMAVTAIVWAVRQEGRINSEQAAREALGARHDDRLAAIERRSEMLEQRIEAKLDRIEGRIEAFIRGGHDIESGRN